MSASRPSNAALHGFVDALRVVMGLRPLHRVGRSDTMTRFAPRQLYSDVYDFNGCRQILALPTCDTAFALDPEPTP